MDEQEMLQNYEEGLDRYTRLMGFYDEITEEQNKEMLKVLGEL